MIWRGYLKLVSPVYLWLVSLEGGDRWEGDCGIIFEEPESFSLRNWGRRKDWKREKKNRKNVFSLLLNFSIVCAFSYMSSSCSMYIPLLLRFLQPFMYLLQLVLPLSHVFLYFPSSFMYFLLSLFLIMYISLSSTAMPVLFTLSVAYCLYILGPWSLLGQGVYILFYPIMVRPEIMNRVVIKWKIKMGGLFNCEWWKFGSRVLCFLFLHSVFLLWLVDCVSLECWNE